MNTYEVEIYRYPVTVTVQAKNSADARRLAAEEVDFSIWETKARKVRT